MIRIDRSHYSTAVTFNIVLVIRAVPDLFFPIQPEPDFQIDCNFTNSMCKTLWMYEWFEFLIILCSSYHYDFLNIWISYVFRSTRLSYYSSKLSNVWEKSTFQIRQNYPAPVGFLPELDFFRIWKKCQIPARAGAEIGYSQADQLSLFFRDSPGLGYSVPESRTLSSGRQNVPVWL